VKQQGRGVEHPPTCSDRAVCLHSRLQIELYLNIYRKVFWKDIMLQLPKKLNMDWFIFYGSICSFLWNFRSPHRRIQCPSYLPLWTPMPHSWTFYLIKC